MTTINNNYAIAQEIMNRANKHAANSNFEISGWDQHRFCLAIQATLEILSEKGLLTGCLLCKNTTNEKEVQS